jgi:hypothetical protein
MWRTADRTSVEISWKNPLGLLDQFPAQIRFYAKETVPGLPPAGKIDAVTLLRSHPDSA